jgi:DNA-binding response OmpR family regulator
MGGGSGRIHVVDDDTAVRESLRALFEAEGYVVESFNSADEFLDLSRHAPCDCAVIDMHLPGPSGLDLLRRLRGESRSGPPVVIITGRPDTTTRQRIASAGGDAYLEKPIDSEVLLGTVRRLMPHV